jgi:hypothetical protein
MPNRSNSASREDVVEVDDADVVGHAHARGGQAADQPDRQMVVVGDHG